MRKKKLLEELRDLNSRVKKLEQTICKHKKYHVMVRTEGHWRGIDYVSGITYIGICDYCGTVIEQISARDGQQLSEQYKEKLDDLLTNAQDVIY